MNGPIANQPVGRQSRLGLTRSLPRALRAQPEQSIVAFRSGDDIANRRRTARRKLDQLQRPGWIANVIQQARQVAHTLAGCGTAELHHHTDRLRIFRRQQTETDESGLLILAAAAVIESVRRTLGMQLFDTQLHAGIIVSQGAVAEMQTGEGKTLAVALPAYFGALLGRGMHIATPNCYLAQRDRTQLAPVFSALGMTTALLRDGCEPKTIRDAYRADLTYAPGHAFGFHYLRDQLMLDRFRTAPGQHPFGSRWCTEPLQPRLLQRGLHASIVDEIDHVLIDDAVSPLLLSGGDQGESPDADIHRAACKLAAGLEIDRDFQLSNIDSPQLTERGFARVYNCDSFATDARLVRPWHQYVVLALRARHSYRRDVNYIVRDRQVQIVDRSTGRILPDRTWSDGVHQAIETRENLPASCERLPLARITRQRFYRLYRSLAGLTGTASGCEREFAAVYGLPVAVVSLRTASRRRYLPDNIALTRKEKFSAICDECESIVRDRRAVLIGTPSIADSKQLAAELDARGLRYQLLNGVQDADEANIIAQGGRPGAITVATNLAGRGTDIPLDPRLETTGGLHVVVAERHRLARVDRQLIGRCARCGDPGSARIFASADDALFADTAPWLGRAIRRWRGRRRCGHLDLSSSVRRVQAAQQRRDASMRRHLMQADRDDQRLLAGNDGLPGRCVKL